MPRTCALSMIACLSLIADLAACSSSATQNPAPVEPQPGQRDPSGSGSDAPTESIWNQQGSQLLAAPPSLEPFSVATTGWVLRGSRASDVALVDGELRIVGAAGQTPVGATFTATAADGAQRKLRITAVVPDRRSRPHAASGKAAHYVIEYEQAGRWQALCPGDAAGATPIPGSFQINPSPKGPISNGDYSLSADRLTFSCSEGVAAKCVDWGYAPWLEHGQMAAYFQACTRMARADYCGTGHSRTVEGTTINYGDFHAPVIARFVPMSGFVPEAVWGTGSGTQGQPAAICLARSRWRTLPIGDRSPCAELMPDPRTSPGASRGFCDENVADWSTQGALFVNMSRIIDVGLVRWTDGAGHYETTAQFSWDGAAGDPADAHGPAGYPTFASVEGSIYKAPPPVKVRGLVPLYRYTKRAGKTQLALTTTEPVAGEGFGDRALEGYIFAPSADPPVEDAQALILYRDDHGGFVTTTEPTPPAGFARVRVIGWLPH